MMYPSADDVLASIIDTFDRYIIPEVDDEYAASLCLTVSQLLRSVRVRVAEEPAALHADNAELRVVLTDLADTMPAELGEAIDTACTPSDSQYPPLAELQDTAADLRALLVRCIETIPDRDDPRRAVIRTYLSHQLGRQQPWLIDAFDGPRR